jgi:hypothetical protein
MASDPRISERIYQDIRRRLFAGAYRLRDRLDVGTLAGALGASATPVREALVRLATERLIAWRPSKGFFVSLWTEGELRALYQWRGMLAELALASARAAPAPAIEAASYPERVARLLCSLNGAMNPELRRAADNADDRLFAARMAETDVFADWEAELAGLAQSLTEGGAKRARTALIAYHARRAAAARTLRERAVVRALPVNGA